MEQEFRYDVFEREPSTKKPKREIEQANSRSIVSLPDSYVVAAILTTGDDPEVDFLIEISLKRYTHGVEVGAYEELVRPESYYLISQEELERTNDYCIVDGGPVYYINQRMVQRTGITNEMLCRAKDQLEVLQEIDAFLGDSVLVGYDIASQIAFINQLFRKSKMPPLSNPYVDCKSIATQFREGKDHHSLNELAILHGISYEGPERSDKIGRVIHQVYQELHPEKISLENKVCVFTGTLQKMVRGKAMQLVRSCGGVVGTSVTMRTDYLIVGGKEEQIRRQGKKSTKLRKAERMLQDGLTINIIPEEVFYDMVGYHRTL